MGAYIKDFDLEEFHTEDDWDKYYDELEQKDKQRQQKRQTKMRNYEGYEAE